jgi:hypothetical protein
MLGVGHLYRRSTDNKQRVNNRQTLPSTYKKQNVAIDNAASSGEEGKYTKYVSFPCSLQEAALPIFNVISR